MKIALLFPGYGSQYVGMGKDLYDEYRIVQEYFEEASNCLSNNFVKLCFASSDAELSKMANAYTSLFLVSSAVYAVLKENDIEPHVVSGYNNGECAALFAAGCFSLPDGLYLLNKFCSFYQEIVDGMDVDAIHVKDISKKRLSDICKDVSETEGKAFIALYNSSTDHVVAGNRDQLSAIADIIDGSGKVEYIGIEGGLHSELMNPVIEQFKMYLEKVDFNDLRIPLISSIDGKIVTRGEDTKDRFISHINSPLRFDKVLSELDGYDCILIAAPGDTLLQQIKTQYPQKTVVSIAKKADIDKLKEIINVPHEKAGLTDDN